MNNQHEQRFPFGQILLTPGAQEELSRASVRAEDLLERHGRGDWGDLSQEDRDENDLALREGFRLLSAYQLTTGQQVWVITEADRSATTLLLPEEY